MKKIYFFLILFFSCTVLYSQPAVYWSNVFSTGNFRSYGAQVITDYENNIYTCGVRSYYTGYGFNIILLKYTSKGTLVWSKIFSDGNPSVLDHIPKKTLIDNDGNILIGGISTRNDIGSSFLVLKYNSQGDLLWNYEYNFSSSSSDSLLNMEIDDDDNIYLAGNSYSPQNIFSIVKLNPNGQELWRKNNTAGDLSRMTVMKIDNAGNVYLSGVKKITNGNDNIFSLITLKYDRNGNFNWQKNLPVTGEYNRFIPTSAITTENGLFISATVSRVVYSNLILRDILILNYDLNGNLIWSQVFDGGKNIFDEAVDINYYGNSIYVAGRSNINYILLKYNDSGNFIWSRSFESNPYNISSPEKLIVHQDNIYVMGNNTLKFNSTGDLIWGIYNLNHGDVSLDNNSDLIYTGYTSDQIEKIITKKYSELTNVDPSTNHVLQSYSLLQNYPNPFNPVTNIKFSLPTTQYTILKIFDIAGREIATLVNEQLNAGEYNYQFNADDFGLSSGVYFYQLFTEKFVQTKRFVLIK